MSDTPAKRAREARKRRKQEEKKDRKLHRKLNPLGDEEASVEPEQGDGEPEQVDTVEPVPSPEG
jgi:hypothetical protein